MASTTKRNAKMTLRHEPEADVLAVEFAPRQRIDYATEAGNLVVHFSPKGRPVLVEILNASQFADHAHAITRRTVRSHRMLRRTRA
ncbi:DUF2283 domain-containing protein [Candidatus Uhrbacteria bacterium]|nr:DUF2283 domain-containing protein [Candidatus Uhrbacteria bacterium]